MRIFIAVDLSRECKGYISSIQREMERELEQKGTKVPEENFHITLEFLGETDECGLKLIESAMDDVKADQFDLRINGRIGSFRRGINKGRVYFIQIDHSRELEEMQWRLHQALKERGFRLEERPFKPHITLFRNAYMKGDIEVFRPFKDHIDSIKLMKSERIRGRMAYTPLYVKSLNNPV